MIEENQPVVEKKSKSWIFILILVIIMIIIAIVFYFLKFSSKNTNSSESDITCVDPDGGLNYNSQSQLIFRQTLKLNESANSNIIKILSNTRANFKFSGFNSDIELGRTYNFVQKDETYTTGGQKGILRDVSTEIKIKKIDFFGLNNTKNNIEIEMTTTNIDECASKYNPADTKGLIENSCTRHIDEYYSCPNNCLNGACV